MPNEPHIVTAADRKLFEFKQRQRAREAEIARKRAEAGRKGGLSGKGKKAHNRKRYKPWGKTKKGGPKQFSSKLRGQISQKYTYSIKSKGHGNKSKYKSWIAKSRGKFRFSMNSGSMPKDTYKPISRVQGYVGAREYVDANGKLRKSPHKYKIFSRTGANGGVMTHQQWLVHLQIAAHSIPVNAMHFRTLMAQRAHTIFLENFQKQKFEGKSWKSLSASRERQRRKWHSLSHYPGTKLPPTWPGYILADSGNLFNSITQKEEGEKSIVGAEVPYAIYHNSGVGKLPQRQFMGHTAAFERFADAYLDKYMFHDVFVSVV